MYWLKQLLASIGVLCHLSRIQNYCLIPDTGFFMAKVGYIRALEDAAIKKQEENLTASGCEKLFSDRAGLRSPRPNWDKLLEYLRTGDVLVVT
mgnify:CR=1 FL=1